MAEGSTPDYWKMITEQRNTIMEVLKATDWVEAKNKGGVKVTYRQTDKGRIWHLETELDCSPAIGKRYQTPSQKDGGLREKFQKKSPLKDMKLVEDHDKYFIMHETLAGAMLGVISERDFVSVYGGEDESDNGAYLVQCSIEHPDYPARPKPVRGTKHILGDIFLPVEGDPNKCIYHEVSLVDLGGMLPVSVINSFVSGVMHGTGTELKQAVANKFHEKN